MEKVKFNANIEKTYREKLIEELKKDQDICQLLKDNNWSKEVIEQNVISFSDWLSQNKQCANCQGLYMCCKQIKGYKMYLDGNFNEILIPCNYKTQDEQLYAHQKNYLICDLSRQSLLNDLDNISLADEDEYYCQIVDICKDWLEHQPLKGMYLQGKLGVGKTYLASCISNGLTKKGYKAAFVNVPRLCVDLKSNMTEKDYIDDKIRKMRNAYILVLDDIGAENLTAWFRDEILFTILDYRMENKKRTIFTSNCDLDSLKNRLSKVGYGTDDEVKGARIIERIKVLSKVIPLVGQTRRSI